MPIPKVYKATLAEHRRRLDRITDRRGIPTLRKLYRDAQTELEKRLRAYGAGAARFEAHQARVMLAQVRQGQLQLARRLRGELGDISLEAQTEALRGLTRDLTKLEKHFTGADVVLPIDEAARFRGVIDGRRESLLRAHDETLANYAANVVTKAEDAMSMSLATGQDFASTVEGVMGVTDTSWFGAERIVRTETAWAFNATHADGIAEVAEEVDDMYMRWVEHVDDGTGAPLDDRVDDDSLVMHGQVARPGDVFRFPTSLPAGVDRKRVERFFGESWSFPPMRPNDRATLSPWRPHWGIPGWRVAGGRRIDMEE